MMRLALVPAGALMIRMSSARPLKRLAAMARDDGALGLPVELCRTRRQLVVGEHAGNDRTGRRHFEFRERNIHVQVTLLGDSRAGKRPRPRKTYR